MAAPRKKTAFIEFGDRFRKEPATIDSDGIPYEGHFTRKVFDKLLGSDQGPLPLHHADMKRHDLILAAALEEDRRTDGAAGAVAGFQIALDAHASNQVAKGGNPRWQNEPLGLVARFVATPPAYEEIRKHGGLGHDGAEKARDARLQDAQRFGLELDRVGLDRQGHPNPEAGDLATALLNTEHLIPAMDAGWKPRNGQVQISRFRNPVEDFIPKAPAHDFWAHNEAARSPETDEERARPEMTQRNDIYHTMMSGVQGHPTPSPYRMDSRWRDLNGKPAAFFAMRRYPEKFREEFQIYPGRDTIRARNMLRLADEGYISLEKLETKEYVVAAFRSQDPGLLASVKEMDPNTAQDVGGRTALFDLMACTTPRDHPHHGLKIAVSAMRDYGLDPFHPDKSGKSALEVGLEAINPTKITAELHSIHRDPEKTAKFLDRVAAQTDQYPLNEARQPAYQVLALLRNDKELADKSGLTQRMTDHPESVAFEVARFSEATEVPGPTQFFRDNGGRFETLQLATQSSERGGCVMAEFQYAWKKDLEAEGKSVGLTREARVYAAAQARYERARAEERQKAVKPAAQVQAE